MEDTNRKDKGSNLIVINKPKKILVATGIYPPDIGGPATYSKLLKEELPKYSKDKVRAIILNFGEVRRWPKIIRHLLYFFKALYRGRYCDVIYAQDPVSVGLPALWAARILRKPFILKIVGDYAWEQGTARYGLRETVDDFSARREGYPRFIQMLKKIEAHVASKADAIVTPSFYLKRIVGNWGIDAGKIQVIYNSFELPPHLESKETIRKKWKVSGQIIVSAGRLVPWKGFDVLIESMPDILRLHPEAKLLILGEGPERKALEAKVQSLDLADSVCLTGLVEHEQLLVYLRLADVFVLNTNYEGFSHQLLEVAAMRTPIITTKVGGNAEIVESERSGILLSYNDRPALVSAVHRILSEPQFGRSLADRAEKRVEEFNVERMTTDLIRLVLRLAASPNGE